MILEGIVTTLGPDGRLNVAPMGPDLDPAGDTAAPRRFILKPFHTSRTHANLRAHPEGVLHVTDDVLLFARAATGNLPPPATAPALFVRGQVLTGVCRHHEFRIVAWQEGERALLQAEVVHTAEGRPWFGFNRARHAVLEAAILATRTMILPRAEVEVELARLAVPVRKTGGPAELEAFDLISRFVAGAYRTGGDPPP